MKVLVLQSDFDRGSAQGFCRREAAKPASDNDACEDDMFRWVSCYLLSSSRHSPRCVVCFRGCTLGFGLIQDSFDSQPSQSSGHREFNQSSRLLPVDSFSDGSHDRNLVLRQVRRTRGHQCVDKLPACIRIFQVHP